MTVSASEQTISHPDCNQPKQKCCSSCGADFTCGPKSPEQSCWCEDLPQTSLVASADQDCLCPACLTAAIAKLPRADAHISTASEGTFETVPTLVAGEDYYCEG